DAALLDDAAPCGAPECGGDVLGFFASGELPLPGAVASVSPPGLALGALTGGTSKPGTPLVWSVGTPGFPVSARVRDSGRSARAGPPSIWTRTSASRARDA